MSVRRQAEEGIETISKVEAMHGFRKHQVLKLVDVMRNVKRVEFGRCGSRVEWEDG